MRWKIAGAAIILMGILLIAPISSQLSWGVVRRKSLSQHAPIRIIGDEQLDRMHGVTRRSGTISDPHVIEGWDIEPSPIKDTCAGIVMEDTTAYVTIRNVRIHGPSRCDGVQMSNASNARIEGNVLTVNGRGIAITGSWSVIVLENTVEEAAQGIVASHSRSILVQDNIVRRAEQAIFVEDSWRVSIVGNVVANSTANGITLLRSSNNTIETNEVTNSAFKGISMYKSSHDIVAGNVVSQSAEQCIYMPYGQGNILTGNLAEACGWGAIDILNGSGIVVSRNEARRTLGTGISLSNCSNSALIANKVSLTGVGILVSSNGDFNLVAHNSVANSQTVGIALVGSPLGSPDYNLIQGNTVLISGEFDLKDASNGKENIWRLNTYTTADVPTLP